MHKDVHLHGQGFIILVTKWHSYRGQLGPGVPPCCCYGTLKYRILVLL